MGDLSAGTRFRPDPECVLEDEPAHAVPVRSRLWDRPAGIASRLFCAHYINLAHHCRLPCNRVVCHPTTPDLRASGGVANRARPRETPVALALGFFLAMDIDLRNPRGWRPVGQPALSPDLLWVRSAGCRIRLAVV